MIRALLKQGYQLNDIIIVSKLNNNQEESFDVNKVKLLTIHSIKGLEFKVVILADLNSNVIPYPKKEIDEEDNKDAEIMERKLLYVGMTRAQEKLFMCSYGIASKFIVDINPHYLSMQIGSRMNAFYCLPYEAYLFKESIQMTGEEETVRQWVINELISNYGYPKELIRVEHSVKNFSQIGKVDIAVLNAKTNEPYIFIETKRESVPIEEAINQLKSYMNVCKVSYGIVTNGKNIVFLNNHLERVSDILICNASILPSSVEAYKYIDRITYKETVFERDLSAQEVYVAEVLRGKEDVYILRVKGDSMIEKDIQDGDHVVIDPAATVNDHDIGAVYYNGSTTLKQVMKMGDSVLLLSANPKYEPIHISEGDFSIMGKLVGVIKAL